MRIRFGKGVTDPKLLRELPPDEDNITGFNLATHTASRGSQFTVYLLDGILEQVWQHVGIGYQPKEGKSYEVAGIIAGHPFLDPVRDEQFILATRLFELETPDRSVVHVRIRSDELKRVREQIEAQGLTPVMWYHSHPGHGVFLSSDDTEVTDHIYNADWQVALVVDPSTKEFGLFRGSQQEVVNGYYGIAQEPPEVVITSVYKLAQQRLKVNDADGARHYLNETQKMFLELRKELRYWQDKPGYRDVKNQLASIQLYESATKLADSGRTLEAIQTYERLLNQNPDGFLDTKEQLANLKGRAPTEKGRESPSASTVVNPQVSGGTHADRNQQRHKRQPSTHVQRRREDLNRDDSSSSTSIVPLLAVGLFVGGIMAVVMLVGGIIFFQPGVQADTGTPTEPQVVIVVPNEEEQSTAVPEIAPTLSPTTTMSSSPTLTPTSMPSPLTPTPTLDLTATLDTSTSTLTLQATEVTDFIPIAQGKVIPSDEPVNNPGFGTLIIRVFNDMDQPIEEVEVEVTAPNGSIYTSRTNVDGIAVQDKWTTTPDIQVRLIGTSSMIYRGNPVTLDVTAGQTSIVEFTVQLSPPE